MRGSRDESIQQMRVPIRVERLQQRVAIP
jgi:hypothetical protein